jgi:peptide/nickel transport system permease protein
MTTATLPTTGELAARRRLDLGSASPVFLAATALLVLHLVVALAGPLLAPYDPEAPLVGDPFDGRSADHWLGTDNFGRDVFSRLVAGERVILIQSIATSAIAVSVGSMLGIVAAYRRGWFDAAVMRVVELVLSFPSLIIGMLLLTVVGPSRVTIVFIVAALFVAPVTTVVRAAALSVVTEDFVTVARLRGESRLAIAWREILPNVLPTAFVEFSLRTGYAAILIGTLAFLGFGAAPPTPDWGLMISEGRDYVSAAPWAVLAPSLALGSLVVGLSLFTEGVTDLLSPRGLGGKDRR